MNLVIRFVLQIVMQRNPMVSVGRKFLDQFHSLPELGSCGPLIGWAGAYTEQFEMCVWISRRKRNATIEQDFLDFVEISYGLGYYLRIFIVFNRKNY